jgi:hypothetical protein
MFKIMNKMDKCDRYNRFKIILNQVRGHCFKYFKEITRQPYRENFFYNRIVNIWNQLPSEIVEATSVNSFKAGSKKVPSDDDTQVGTKVCSAAKKNSNVCWCL